nr:MAG TPA: hypothetical protein [Caudoviricetes sp.]
MFLVSATRCSFHLVYVTTCDYQLINFHKITKKTITFLIDLKQPSVLIDNNPH